MDEKLPHIATEQRTLDQALRLMDLKRRKTRAVLARVKRVASIPEHARILDVGAAQGGVVAACNELGYRCEGVEPWEGARATARLLGNHLGVPVPIAAGTAEAIPFESERFDFVHAASVVEHVTDVDKAFSEMSRVLKKGGVLWFSTASSMCPRQNEIRGFPLFGWYPDALKRRIMNWAKDAKPHLVGHTETPAIHWFTPWKARRLLRRHGFNEVYDRWDLRAEDEGGRAYRVALRFVRSSGFTKILADVFVLDCAYAAIK